MAERRESTSTEPAGSELGWGEGLRRWLDVIAKIVGAVAVVVVGVFAARLESNYSSVALLNQREQADSELRASMLETLITPILGALEAGKEIDPERQRLIAELLTLNFHESFEFKPLLVSVYSKLTNEESQGSLESVARRVIDRQINMLNASARNLGKDPITVVDFYFKELETQEEMPRPSVDCVEDEDQPTIHYKALDDIGDGSEKVVTGKSGCFRSDDGAYTVRVTALELDFARRLAKLWVGIFRDGSKTAVQTFDFWSSAFDFPLTDNAVIDSKHRFAIAMYSMTGARMVNASFGGTSAAPQETTRAADEPTTNSAKFKFVWFPDGYVGERERPLNYGDIRGLLGIVE